MSDIEWTTETWNPVTGCQRVSEGCQNCYAEQMAGRLKQMGVDQYEDVVDKPDGVDEWRWTGDITLVEHRLSKPLRWTHDNLRIFVDSMSDLFHPDVPFEYIAACFGVMAVCSEHTFQILTKRPGRMREFFKRLESKGGEKGHLEYIGGAAHRTMFDGGVRPDADHSGWFGEHGEFGDFRDHEWPLPNVWLGVSAEHQEAADERIPPLPECPAAVRFVSAEPLLGEVNFGRVTYPDGDICSVIDTERANLAPPWGQRTLDWIIVGGESGDDARPCRMEWVDSIREQCSAADVPLFIKQLGAKPMVPGADSLHPANHKRELPDLDDPKGGDPDEWPDELRVREFPEEETDGE